MTVGELEDRMGAAEFLRWSVYEQEEPFLIHRVDMAGGIVASTVANVNRGKNTKPFETIDFTPFLNQARERTRVEHLQRARFPEPIDADDAIVQRLVAAYG